MASTPPVVTWKTYDSDSSSFSDPIPYKWDAGIVEAGSSSDKAEFYVWNNFKGTDAVADMINVRISVKDADGEDVDKRICGDSTDPTKQATVNVEFFNESMGSDGQWGSYDSTQSWQNGTQTDLTSKTPRVINQCSGTAAVSVNGGTVSGGANTGALTDSDNFIRLRLQLTAKGSADAGTINWLTRISYQYT